MSKHELNKNSLNMSQKVVGKTLLVKPLFYVTVPVTVFSPGGPLLDTATLIGDGIRSASAASRSPRSISRRFFIEDLRMKFSEISPKSNFFFLGPKKTHETRETSRFCDAARTAALFPTALWRGEEGTHQFGSGRFR